MWQIPLIYVTFILSSVVQKGSIKLAISTNGKSPTIAKRLKEILNHVIPDEMENVLDNLAIIRSNLNGNFSKKVKKLNDITSVLVEKQAKNKKKQLLQDIYCCGYCNTNRCFCYLSVYRVSIL